MEEREQVSHSLTQIKHLFYFWKINPLWIDLICTIVNLQGVPLRISYQEIWFLYRPNLENLLQISQCGDLNAFLWQFFRI
jgi:hypothetical protein